MPTIIILLILLISQTENCYGQRDNSDFLINRFRNDIQIEQKEHAGVVVMDDETKESYYLVIINSSIKYLVKYTNDTNAIVRSYIFAGLLRKKINKDVLLKILDIHKNDTARFTSQGADVIIKWTVRDFMQAGMELKSNNKLSNIDYKKEIEEIRSQTSVKIKIGGIHHGLIEKEELLKIDNLILPDNKFKIISFTLFIADETIKSSSNILTNDIKIAIRKAVPGDVLLFGDIRVVNEDKIVRQLASMSIKLE